MRDRKCKKCGVNGGHSEDCQHWEPPAKTCKCSTADGQPKTPFTSRGRALESAIATARAKGYARIYPCPTSPRFHVTAQPQRTGEPR